METFQPERSAFLEVKFKSYYVVWKPGSSFSPTFEYSTFKSYYVVWKLFILYIIYYILLSLNRTM